MILAARANGEAERWHTLCHHGRQDMNYLLFCTMARGIWDEIKMGINSTDPNEVWNHRAEFDDYANRLARALDAYGEACDFSEPFVMPPQ